MTTGTVTTHVHLASKSRGYVAEQLAEATFQRFVTIFKNFFFDLLRLLIHNRGVANKTYESKAGNLARYRDGHRIDIPEHYHRQTWLLIHKVVADLSDATIAKA